MNTKSIKNLIVLGAMIALLVSSKSAFAYAPYVPWEQSVQPPIGYSYAPINNNEISPLSSGNGVVHSPSNSGPVQTSNSTSNTSNQTSTIKKVTATSSTDKSTASQATKADIKEIPPVVTTDSSNNGLTALSLAGSGGFMPSSIWQWLLVVFLILVIIIISRILSRHHTHDAHAVAAH